jgi:SAM-dependent methyltransferase
LLKVNDSIPWFKKWFNESYLSLYQHRDESDARDQVSLILGTLSPTGEQPILDLGCGVGRHLSILRRQGYRAFGLDLSETLLREGIRMYGRLPVIQGDMRAIPGYFSIILSLFTSFGYFESHASNQKVIQSISRALKPGGWFWLDFLNPTYLRSNLEARSVSQTPAGQKVVEKRRICQGRVIKDIMFRKDNEAWDFQESVRLYSRQELELMLAESDMVPHGFFGNYRGEEWHENSPRTIIFARKSE